MSAERVIRNMHYVSAPSGIGYNVGARIESLHVRQGRTRRDSPVAKTVWLFLFSCAAGFTGFGVFLVISGEPVINILSPSLLNLAGFL